MRDTVTDASDFKGTSIPGLAQLDSLLRCHICKDFLKVPVLTPCGHTFCSVCIREYIAQSSKCPLCLKELRDSMLRSEFLVNEVTECYKMLRQPLLLALMKAELDPNKETESNRNDDDDSAKKQTAESSLIQVDSDTDSSLLIANDDDIQILSTSSLIEPRKFEKLSNTAKKRSISTVESMFNNKKMNQQTAQCPICSDFFPIKTLERTHLDECLNLQSLGKLPRNKNKKPKLTTSRANLTLRKEPTIKRQNTLRNNTTVATSSNTPTPTSTPVPEISHVSKYLKSTTGQVENRLPKLDHNTLTVSQLRSKLSSLGLNTNGTRQNLIDRYNHYELIWNSNFVDSIDPVDEKDLKRQLVAWENSHSTATNTNNTTIGKLLTKKKNYSNNSYIQLMENFKNDKFNRKGWCELFHKEFKRLIREAKRNNDKLKYKENIEQNATIVEDNLDKVDEQISESPKQDCVDDIENLLDSDTSGDLSPKENDCIVEKEQENVIQDEFQSGQKEE